MSPSDSIASGYSKPAEPVARTARQIAAAAAKAKAKAKAADDSEDDTGDERRGTAMAVSASADSLAPSGALGVDLGGSREGSSAAAAKKRSRKRGRDDASASDEEDEEPPRKNGKKSTAAAAAAASAVQTYEEAEPEGDGTAGENELDSKVYCTCRQVSYGEMIGCDDDDCEIEWYHVACLNLDKAPEGNWICPQCIERRKRHPKSKKPSKAKRK